MNLQHIFHEIEKTDPEIYDRMDDRRSLMKSFSNIGGKLALAVVPIALGSFFKKSYGQSGPATSKVLEILNYALLLEYLEAEFYATAVTKGLALMPNATALGAIQTISNHETAHVDFLKKAITATGGVPRTKPTFDFSAGSGSGNGPFKTVFDNYELFLAVAQTFEDTGVRAYKGRAAELVRGGDLLTAALNIHSVEARHASHIRQMRKANGFGDVKPWITGKITGVAGADVSASYNGEENVTQATITITALPGVGGNISSSAATEAFDEGLSVADVTAIVTPFIKP